MSLLSIGSVGGLSKALAHVTAASLAQVRDRDHPMTNLHTQLFRQEV